MTKEAQKKKWPGWLVIVLTVAGLALLGQASKSVIDLSATPTPVPTPNEKFMKDLSDLFCLSRQGVNAYGNYICIGCANLDDIDSFLNNSEVVSIHQAKEPPKKESCDKVAKDCVKLWDQKTCTNLASQKYWIGMTKDQLVVSLGLPNEQNNTVGSWGFHTQWVYGTYGPYIYLEGKDEHNLKVTSYQN